MKERSQQKQAQTAKTTGLDSGLFFAALSFVFNKSKTKQFTEVNQMINYTNNGYIIEWETTLKANSVNRPVLFQKVTGHKIVTANWRDDTESGANPFDCLTEAEKIAVHFVLLSIETEEAKEEETEEAKRGAKIFAGLPVIIKESLLKMTGTERAGAELPPALLSLINNRECARI